MKPLRQGILYGLVGLAILWGAPQVSAQASRERMTLSFSDPVRIPGKVLPAGKYLFKLAPASSNRNIVQIFDEGGSELLATTVTVPKKRAEPKGDVVLTFGAAAAGAPPALQAYFYPGTIYGHEFVYPEAEARELAARHRTLVLSHDVKGSDYESATLRVFNDRGEGRDFVAQTSASGGSEPDAKAPMVMADRQGQKVKLDTLEENPSKYVGQQISVDAEVEEIYGPRLFTIDEPNWGDLDGEVLVFMPTALAALVAENDRVTISGTMRPFVKTELEREWGWLEATPEVEADFSIRHVLVAERLIGGQGDLAMRISTDPAPVGTSGGTAAGAATPRVMGKGPALDSVSDIATASEDAIGRTVDLNGVTVAEIQKDGGFWVRDAQGNRAFVLPQDHRDSKTKVTAGQSVSIDGVTLSMPDGMRDRLNPGPGNADLYVFATSITR